MTNYLDLLRHIGETVIIFTTSGGDSGSGFTGVLISVNPNFVRLITQQGTPPTNPFGSGNSIGLPGRVAGGFNSADTCYNVGSVCDIPINKIASFCHNAI